MNKLFKRFIYDNYLRKSRLKKYESYLLTIKKAGYTFITIEGFMKIVHQEEGFNQSDSKYCIIRHDVDTDPRTAYYLFLIEKKNDIKSTYYYRWRTIDKKTMNEMINYGNEVGYHYEEVSEYSKRHKLRSKREVDAHIDIIRKMFINNYLLFRRMYGNANTCASHGEWINKYYLKLPNKYLMDDEVRKCCGISFEAYDEEFMKYVNCRISDLGSIDGIWTPYNVEQALEKNPQVLHLLIHPRQWYSRLSSNFSADFTRIIETIKYNYL